MVPTPPLTSARPAVSLYPAAAPCTPSSSAPRWTARTRWWPPPAWRSTRQAWPLSSPPSNPPPPPPTCWPASSTAAGPPPPPPRPATVPAYSTRGPVSPPPRPAPSSRPPARSSPASSTGPASSLTNIATRTAAGGWHCGQLRFVQCNVD